MSPEAWAAVQAGIAAITTIAVAWIGVQQIRAKAALAEAEKRQARADQRMNDIETQVAEVTQSMQKEGF